MKNKLLLILTILLLLPVTVKATERSYLYDVLKKEAEEGTYAKEYTGEHNDTIGGGNKKIYHWYSDNQTTTNAIKNKFNVIFGGFCWEMIRTTDGGGTKIMYNGVPENNKCLDDRKAHGIVERNNYTYLNGTVVGDSYYYNENDNKYYVTDIYGNGDLNEDNYLDIIGKYTCDYSSASTGCTQIKQITAFSHKYINYNNTLSYYYIVTTKTNVDEDTNSSEASQYYSIGNYMYTGNVDDASTLGYMYDDVDPNLIIESKSVPYGKINVSVNKLSTDEYNIIENNSTYKYEYDTDFDRWTVTNRSYSATVLKFKLEKTGDLVLSFGFNCNYIDMYIYRNGEIIKQLEYTNYIWSDQKMILKDVTSDDLFEIRFKASYGSDPVSMNFYVGTINGEINDTRMVFGNSFTYSNGKYKLKDLMYNDGTDSIKNNHYTCLTTSDECEEIYYAISAYQSRDGASQSIIKFTNGKGIDYYLNQLFYKDDINKKDSIIKQMVDKWFENNLLNYERYLEPTIYCNKRAFANKETNYFNPNGGTDSPEFFAKSYDSHNYDQTTLNNYIYNQRLDCPNVTDQFSVLNPKAKLKYSVALPTAQEFIITSTKNINYFIFNKYYDYHTMSPYSGMRAYTTVFSSHEYYNYGANSRATRPVVTLKSNVEYASGTGSKEDPYIIADLMYSNILTENDDAKGTLNIVGDTEDIRNDTLVKFTVEKKKGFNVNTVKVYDDVNNEIELTKTGNTYKFNMPTSDVRVVVTYNPVINIINTLKNMNTAFIAIILVIIGYATYLLIRNRKKSK